MLRNGMPIKDRHKLTNIEGGQKCSLLCFLYWVDFVCFVLFTPQSTIFQLCRDGSSWVEPDHNGQLFQRATCINELIWPHLMPKT